MKIAVIGGGITGLTAAYYLSKKGHDVVVFEKGLILGGLAASFKTGDTYLEKFVHHFFWRDVEALNLIKELNLKDKLIWKEPKNSIYYKKNIYPFNNAFDLLNFSPLSFKERLRCGLVVLYLKLNINYQQFEDTTALKWLDKSMGGNVSQIIWEPLLRKKFCKDYKNIAMAWMWARIFYRTQKLGYLLGSLETLVKKMSEEIARNKGSVKTGKKIIDLKPLLNNFDKILVTVDPQTFLKIAGNRLPESYQNKLKKIKYYSAVSLVIFMKKSLTKDVYWLNINDYKIPFIVCVEHTQFIVNKDNRNQNIVYLEAYIESGDKILSLKDNQIFENWEPYLKRINNQFNKSWVNSYKVFKEKFAQPVVRIGYRHLISQLSEPVKNIYFASMCQIYPQDRGVNYAIKLGKEAAEKLII